MTSAMRRCHIVALVALVLCLSCRAHEETDDVETTGGSQCTGDCKLQEAIIGEDFIDVKEFAEGVHGSVPLDSFSLTHVVKHEIPHMEWQPDKAFADEVIARGMPVVLTNTVVEKWPARTKWTDPNYLGNHPDLINLKRVKESLEFKFFDLDMKSPMLKTKESVVNSTLHYKQVNMTGRQFFRRILDPEDKHALYWYGPLHTLDGILHRDVYPDRFMYWKDYDVTVKGMFIWLSSKGPQAWIHADSDHNFFVHLSGTKRFTVFSPTEYDKLYIYPRVHPKWHKSQVDFADPDLTRFPRYANVTAYSSLLRPGDVLYVPQYWFHHVESVTPCVSVATWNRGDVWIPMQSVTNREKLHDSYTGTDKLQAVVAHIELLLDALYGEGKSHAFVQEMLVQRWSNIAAKFPADAVDAAICGGLKPRLRKFLERDIKLMVDDLKKIPPALQEINVMDYIELEALSAVDEDATKVYSFFYQCFK